MNVSNTKNDTQNFIERSKEAVKSPKTQRAFLVASVALSALALIPPLRTTGSIALRAVALLSSSLSTSARWSDLTHTGKLLLAGKTAAVGLGLLAVAASLPFLAVASLVGDAGLQTIEAYKAILNKDYERALTHMGIFVIDTLALGAIATGSWKLMVTASLVSAAVMARAAFKAWKRPDSNWVDVACYAALAGLGLYSAVSIAQFTKKQIVDRWIEYRNTSDEPKMILDASGKLVGVVDPGESLRIPVDTAFFTDKFPIMEEGKWVWVDKPYLVEVGRDEFGQFEFERTYEGMGLSQQNLVAQVVTQKPIAPHLLPTVPVGGTQIVEQEKMNG